MRSPPTRITFVAPMLPDPTLRKSPLPANLVNNNPIGTEPNKYEIINKTAYIILFFLDFMFLFYKISEM
jgi:hypothetical protein